jgi:hypothetical protein
MRVVSSELAERRLMRDRLGQVIVGLTLSTGAVGRTRAGLRFLSLSTREQTRSRFRPVILALRLSLSLGLGLGLGLGLATGERA